jgi:hypothetical protein
MMANAQESQSDLIIYSTDDGKANVALYAADGSAWLNQSQLAELFDTSKQNIGQHVSNILSDNELDSISVVKDYFTTAADGKKYNVAFYSLEMIIAIGFRVRGRRGTQFRTWANQNLREYMVKGFVMDDERLKNPDGRPDHFDELLARIRDIRASEKRFYQKVRDLFSLSSDYDATDKATQMFFAETQNKLLFAVTGNTAAELILARADASQPNMGVMSWKGSIVRKGDILIAKNYLNADEIDSLNRLVIIFLETAEFRAKNRQDIPMAFWRENVGRILELNDLPALTGKGAVSHTQMETHVREQYDQFDTRRKQLDAQAADQNDEIQLQELEQLEKTTQARKQSKTS